MNFAKEEKTEGKYMIARPRKCSNTGGCWDSSLKNESFYFSLFPDYLSLGSSSNFNLKIFIFLLIT